MAAILLRDAKRALKPAAENSRSERVAWIQPLPTRRPLGRPGAVPSRQGSGKHAPTAKGITMDRTALWGSAHSDRKEVQGIDLPRQADRQFGGSDLA